MIETYLRAFVNCKQDDWVRLLPMAKFAYNNAKNTSTGYTLFKLNYGYHSKVFFKEDIDPYLRCCSANKLAKELKELMEVCCQNLLHIQELQKRAYDKGIKSRSYASGKKVWLNSKSIKTKRNKKLENKFLGLFQVFYVIGKQVYKLELLTTWKIYDIFHVLLLKQDTTRKKQVEKTLSEPKKDLEFEFKGNKEYKFKAIIDSVVYGQ